MGDGYFQPQWLVLLTDEEMDLLVASRNRDMWQPHLKAYLRSAGRLKQLRRLAFQPTDVEWGFPPFLVRDSGEIADASGSVRGRTARIALPARPGEPQMALAHDWFWEEFTSFLIERGVWATHTADTLETVIPAGVEYSARDAWPDFWGRLSSPEYLNGSLGIYLDSKSLFKNPARAWGAKEIPVLSKSMAGYLIAYYKSGRAVRHFKKPSINEAVESLEKLMERGEYVPIPFPDSSGSADAADHRSTLVHTHIKGGDYAEGQGAAGCLSCGEIIAKKDGYERLAVFVKDADERPQSATDKDKKPRFCARCIATVLLCPVKLTKETLTVRFHATQQNGPGSIAPGNEPVRHELRKYVAQTLHVAAGSFVSLHITEKVDGKELCTTLGACHYALWKMALIFPPELFTQGFCVLVYPGEELFSLSRWLLWYVSSLIHWESNLEYRGWREKPLRQHFFQFLRLTSHGKVFQGFYTLLTGGVIGNKYVESWRMYQLQDIWRQLETMLREEGMPLPHYPWIVGLAGLLLPLAERVESSMDSPTKKKRAIGKLLEEVDRPIQYAYTASRESGSRDFIFCQRPRNRFFFEKAMELLNWSGEDVERLKSEGERIVSENKSFEWAREAESKIFIGPDQIARVTCALVCEGEKPYENEADWRAFAYQVKLALWSMFPQYLGSEASSGGGD